jgi:biotin carboxyl carrier protein
MAKREKKTRASSGADDAAGDNLLNITQIRQLIRLMVDNDVQSISVRDGQMQLGIRRGPDPKAAPTVQAPAAPEAPANNPDDGLVAITAPMVGTFYSAPDPESSPYVTIGAEVSSDTVVCIVEAMKVFNEIKADMAGTVEKICVENAHPIEFGQPLFLVRPRA